MTMKDAAAVVGVGATPFYRRGQSFPQNKLELAGKAIIAAAEDAGIAVKDIDGFSFYAGGMDTAHLAQALGIKEIRWATTLTGGGNGSAGCVGVAAAAVHAGMAETIVCLMVLQQPPSGRFGQAFANKKGDYSAPPTPEKDFIAPSGLVGPGQMFALIAQRHMNLYGTKREHFAEVAVTQRANAIRRPGSQQTRPLTFEDYFNAPMISEPLCLFDFCQETDGCVAVIVTSAARAKDLKQKPVYITASAHGGAGRWGKAIGWFGMPDEYFASSGHRTVAQRVFEMAGAGPKEIDVALLYDHFAPMVLLQLEDYGFCGIGESGPFVEAGNIRWPTGSLPVNTHGGNLSEGYIIGFSHVKEAVEQLRGTAINQVKDAHYALVTGGPAALPVSSIILRNDS